MYISKQTHSPAFTSLKTMLLCVYAIMAFNLTACGADSSNTNNPTNNQTEKENTSKDNAQNNEQNNNENNQDDTQTDINVALKSIGCGEPINSKTYLCFAATSTRVIDGDTVEVTQANKPSERIRFAGIDAPERSQAYGSNSTQNVKDCIKDKKVIIKWFKKDRYDRLVGYIYATSDNKNVTDCNLDQLNKGMAWHYKAYAYEQPEKERISYNNAEVIAKQNKVGLWSQQKPIAPWDYRKGVR